MEREAQDANADTTDQDVREHAAPASSPLSSSEQPAAEAETPAPTQAEEPFNNNIPVFLDRTFRMVESVSDDIVCWSEAGDSFIIKQIHRDRSSSTGTKRRLGEKQR
ncbi:n/a [Ectocarpus siliculosus]|uniref:N/a n=1 Tax=Ectocarpus siliculosus TaxID=2880 RepID=D7G1S3_ECTSI|nr:n/a [Ectocarpus siliculosus]|eukprot:CBJ33318.1 n/a [Ectocarpus siliculosus]